MEKNTTFFRFEDLRVYHKSLDYIHWVREATQEIRKLDQTHFVERFNVTAQNIALYIAEGSSRNKNQFIYYLKQSKAAIRECLVFTTLAHQAGVFSDASEESSRNSLMELTKMLGALINSLQRNNGTNHNGNGHDTHKEEPAENYYNH